MTTYDYLIRSVIVGEANVGKSNFLNSVLGLKFKKEYSTTIGIEFGTKRMMYKNKNFKIQIWDTAGQERFRELIYSYFKSSSVFFLMFDLSNKTTFENIGYWIRQIYLLNDSRKPFIILIGNKSDLQQTVDQNEIDNLVERNKLPYFEISLKSNQNVDKIYTKMVSTIYDDYISKNIQHPGLAGNALTLLQEKPVKNRSYCYFF